MKGGEFIVLFAVSLLLPVIVAPDRVALRMTTGNDGRIYNTFLCEFFAPCTRAGTGLVFRLNRQKKPPSLSGATLDIVVVVQQR
jgi:acid phosphatase family membrane protein YuiD